MRRFITDASHELRTPLTTIRRLARVLSPGRRHGCEDADQAIEGGCQPNGSAPRRRSSAASSPGHPQRPLERRTAPRRPAQLSPRGPARKHAIDGESARSPWRSSTAQARPRCSATRPRQVLGNLVANALQHTPETAGVTVRVGTDRDNAVLEVCDEGPGMTRQDAHRVFERFYRTDFLARSTYSGSAAFGLSIVDSLVVARRHRVHRHDRARAGVSLTRLEPAAEDRRRRRSRSLDAQVDSAIAALILMSSSRSCGTGCRAELRQTRSRVSRL